MEYHLSQEQTVRKLGAHKDIATIIIPPFRCQSLSIDFFCELAEALSENSTCYQMDYSYMKKGHAKEYITCLPEQELSQIKELADEVLKSHLSINLIGMCLGAAFAAYISQQISVNKMVHLSIVDLENFKDFLIVKYKSNLPVAIIPEKSNESLSITKQRAEWYNDRKTSQLINSITAKTLFVWYDRDPYICGNNRGEIINAIIKNNKCSLKLFSGPYHRPGNNAKQIIELTKRFLFTNSN